MPLRDTAEHRRLEDNKGAPPQWWRWGPYVSERAWGTVREDYSAHGDAWRYLTHDLARSKACRWGEDGLAGWCDRYQILVFALALWNGRDPILKERAFGLTPWEGNHGEDVKEYYFYEDNTPTHSYARYRYQYPQARFPYEELLPRNASRGLHEGEFELLDTGEFNALRYFDVQVEYAKATPDDIGIRITVTTRGPARAAQHVLPQLWYRNTWAWRKPRGAAPVIFLRDGARQQQPLCLVADSSAVDPVAGLLMPYSLGTRYLYAQAGDGIHRRAVGDEAERLLLASAVAQKAHRRGAARLAPRPGVAIPQLRRHVQRCPLGAAVGDGDAAAEVVRRRLGVFDLHVEITQLIEHAGVEQFELAFMQAAAGVARQQLFIGKA